MLRLTPVEVRARTSRGSGGGGSARGSGAWSGGGGGGGCLVFSLFQELNAILPRQGWSLGLRQDKFLPPDLGYDAPQIGHSKESVDAKKLSCDARPPLPQE
ncbi:hypothetical protein ElyMa_000793200 [Elysia marginata]|uniref:Uncharacterized protein n=1 Tax=Elysia marginata TaxID=1093978 RepID=A0AAV4GU40_9GAST|nr:hypothetical protein ElyMa_000793200 [Elysia marginata]